MAESNQAQQISERPEGPAAHDRVAMLSLHADGSAAQLNPEIIIDPDDAKVGLTEQLTEQAVSASDGANEALTPAAAQGLADSAKSTADGVVESLKKKDPAKDVGVAAAADPSFKPGDTAPTSSAGQSADSPTKGSAA